LGESFETTKLTKAGEQLSEFRIARDMRITGRQKLCTVKNIQSCWSYQNGDNSTGLIISTSNQSLRGKVIVKIIDDKLGSTIGVWKQNFSELNPTEILFTAVSSKAEHQSLHVFIEPTDEPISDIFISNFRNLDRRVLLPLLEGNGLEIGPGHQPFVKHENVTYLEKFPIETWSSANRKALPEDPIWQKYKIGIANDLPVEDASLDFIFSSHVFEHLANPLGHIEHWIRKLRPGGSVVCIVPAISGARDYRAKPSELFTVLEEFTSGSYDVRRTHFEYYKRLH